MFPDVCTGVTWRTRQVLSLESSRIRAILGTWLIRQVI